MFAMGWMKTNRNFLIAQRIHQVKGINTCGVHMGVLSAVWQATRILARQLHAVLHPKE